MVSAIAGNSGMTALRFAVVTAIARRRPARVCGLATIMLVCISCTCPPTRSTSAGAAPLYGTCVMRTPENLSNSMPMWVGLPCPDEA